MCTLALAAVANERKTEGFRAGKACMQALVVQVRYTGLPSCGMTERGGQGLTAEMGAS